MQRTHYVPYPIFFSLYRCFGSSFIMPKNSSSKTGWWSWSGLRQAHGVGCQCWLKVTPEVISCSGEHLCSKCTTFGLAIRWFFSFMQVVQFSTTGLLFVYFHSPLNRRKITYIWVVKRYCCQSFGILNFLTVIVGLLFGTTVNRKKKLITINERLALKTNDAHNKCQSCFCL